MSKSTLSEGEIFFGIVENDGTRSSLIKRQPTQAELESLWNSYPELFSGTCECGAKNYIFAHTIRTHRILNRVEESAVTFICPECGKRVTLGANYQLSQMRMNVLKDAVK